MISHLPVSPVKVELIGGTLPANWKDLILERPEKLRVEYQEVTWQFQSPEALLEVEKNADGCHGSTKIR